MFKSRWLKRAYLTLAGCVVMGSLVSVLVGPLAVSAATVYNVNPGESIQAAVDKAKSGDTVLVHAGTYAQSVVFDKGKNGVNLRSDHAVLEGSSIAAETAITISDGVQNVAVEGFEISGFKYAGVQILKANGGTIRNNSIHDSVYGVEAWGNNCNIVGNIIGNMVEYGIWLGNVNGSAVDSNTVFHCQADGIWLGNSKSNVVKSNKVSDITGSFGIFLGWKSSGNRIYGNDLKNSADSGIMLHEAANDNEIAENTVSACGYSGIKVETSSGNKVIRNSVSTSGEYGVVVVQGVANIVDGNTVADSNFVGIAVNGADSISNAINNNTVTNSKAIAIVAYYCPGNSITSNRVSNAGEHGVYLASANGNTILTNNISGTGFSGISMLNSSSNRVIGNSIDSVGWDGITAYGAKKNLIEDNTISRPGSCGVALNSSDNGPSTENTVRKNSISNAVLGILLQKSIKNLVQGNAITGSSAEGVYISKDCMENKIVSNTVRDSAYRGILIDLSSNGNTIDNNRISGGKLGGILVDGASANVIVRNTLNDNGLAGVGVEKSHNADPDVLSNDNKVLSNTITNSGVVDLYWDQLGTGNHWEKNAYTTSDPAILP
jgi:parallel beta-helix repeat protein